MTSESDLLLWVKEAQAAISQSSDLDQLKSARLAHAGDKSPIALASRSLGSMAPEDRAAVGKIVGEARAAVSALIAERTEILEAERDARVLLEEIVDVTLPATRGSVGALHPITILKNEISDFFIAQGYGVAEGPELEAEWLNFDALNIPADHPARTMQDTFFVEPLDAQLVLRTHTSPVQIRTMLEQKPPIYVICPGRTFRADELDATHTPVFHQVEGLVIDEGITMAHLKGTLDLFARKMFGDEAITRLRPSFFPFTEPSAEMDISCFVCDQKGCAVCKYSGWVEIGGCGMVDPAVLENCKLDPKKYSGFAFGMGIERITMLKFRVNDLRLYMENDVRFLQQFASAQ